MVLLVILNGEYILVICLSTYLYAEGIMVKVKTGLQLIVICYSSLTLKRENKILNFDIFVFQCIRKWLREQSTCPTCRLHALLPDEFPSLK